ncbi:hypothetical protein MKK69_14105 [Methylobacterium sp. J-026]|uniref:hypothetical protein n=1 Tax=Methylobacterium sp. J-026 TaxID=2836624 RepID=UPI001FBA1A2D|nr:hypothetical protein [Methylobacterium sp. J-026]MCJ2135174.1 hypothetical protein [Methylobacterium sp. J-026]
MTFPRLSVQAMSNAPGSLGALLATFEQELISRVTIWGSARDEAAREAVKRFRTAVTDAASSSESTNLPSFTTLNGPIVHLTPHAAIVSFEISVTVEGLIAFTAYLDKLGLKYVIRDGDAQEYFSANCFVASEDNMVELSSNA